MGRFVRLLAVTLIGTATLGVGFAQEPSRAAPPEVGNPQLRRELMNLEASDQKVRDELIDKLSARPVDSVALIRTIQKMDSVDRHDTGMLKEIVQKYGWPGKSLVGVDGAEAAFILVQHADRDTAFQSRCLDLIRKAYDAGEVTGEDVALLTDRVLVARGQKQLYGSQARIIGHEIIVDPISDSANVDERRAKLGLPPMIEYLRLLRKAYHFDKK